jgi:SAM-dependent methyltransferase
MSDWVQDAVRKGYGAVAKSGLSSEQDGIRGIAIAFGYSAEELASIPAAANMGLSCGNPVAMASLKEGETVVDLGAGGGLDVFLAAQKVGPSGKAIGIDMTADMVSLARRNAAQAGYQNVKFYLAEIEAMPIADNSVDCVISNCVLNLCADKDAALAEIFRILKPGGRLAVSDIALRKALPEPIAREVAAWTGCIAGALTIDDNRDKLAAAGFGDILIQDAGADLNAYRDGGHAACCGPKSDADMSGGAGAGASCCGGGEAAVALVAAPKSMAASGCCGGAVAEPAPADLSSCCGGSAEPALEATSSGCCGGSHEVQETASSCCGGGHAEPISAAEQAEWSACCGGGDSPDEPAFHDTMAGLLDAFDVNEYAASVKIFALKPAG